MIAAPFSGQPNEIYKTEERFRSCSRWPAAKRWSKITSASSASCAPSKSDLDKPGTEARLIFSLNERDAYHDPGTPVLKTTPDGRRLVIQSGDEIYLSRAKDPRPLATIRSSTVSISPPAKPQRLFQSDSQRVRNRSWPCSTTAAKRLLTRRESPTDPPNYLHPLWLQDLKPLTHFPDPTPQTAGIKKQLVTYKRADGVPLSFTLYLPAGL